MVAAIVPDEVAVRVPIVTGEEKLPVAFESWAVYTFPEVKVPDTVYGTEIDAPAQNGEPDIVPVVIVCVFPAKTKNRLLPMAFDPVTPFVPAVPAKEV